MERIRLLDKAKAELVVRKLKGAYPSAKYYLDFKTPLDLLVAAILSAQTRDVVVNKITPALFAKYRTASDYADADESELLGMVKSVTFATNKAKNIIKTCEILMEQHGGKVPETMEELTALPGIGRKTANTILINAYGKVEGIPVDTWVIKVAFRAGLTGEKNPDKIEGDLMQAVVKNEWGCISYVLKAHGHAICRSALPLCSKCVINNLCPRNGVEKSL